MKQKRELSHSKSATPREKTRRGRPAFLKGRHRKPTVIHSVEDADARLFDIFRNHEFKDITDPARRQLAQFYRLLMEEQQRENLTRLLSLRDVAIKHFIDSLIVPRFHELKFPLMDMGTGPGFPGIPLKIAFPEQRIILAEGVAKRVSFLKKVREKLNLLELDIIGRKIDRNFEYPVASIITRAVANITLSLGDGIKSLAPGGEFVFMKGPNVDQEIQEAQAKMSAHYKLKQDISYWLPQTPHERRLVVFERING
jgi:16S rRNA (guanine527-N7)-methyltransferase